MTKQEKQKLKVAKNTFKSTKRNYPQLYRQLRDENIKTLVKSDTPNWGNVRFTITAKGV